MRTSTCDPLPGTTDLCDCQAVVRDVLADVVIEADSCRCVGSRRAHWCLFSAWECAGGIDVTGQVVSMTGHARSIISEVVHGLASGVQGEGGERVSRI